MLWLILESFRSSVDERNASEDRSENAKEFTDSLPSVWCVCVCLCVCVCVCVTCVCDVCVCVCVCVCVVGIFHERLILFHFRQITF